MEDRRFALGHGRRHFSSQRRRLRVEQPAVSFRFGRIFAQGKRKQRRGSRTDGRESWHRKGGPDRKHSTLLVDHRADHRAQSIIGKKYGAAAGGLKESNAETTASLRAAGGVDN